MSHRPRDVYEHLHILGASGSGTSTLGATVAHRIGYTHLDTDHYYWEQTDPPFRQSRERSARQQLLAAALDASPRWVLTGSLCGWGDIFVPRFDLVVFLVTSAEVRLQRLRAREHQRYGAAAVAPGGPMYDASRTFLEWAASYDDGGVDMRSRALHESWLATLPCRVVRLEGDRPLAELAAELRALAARGRRELQ